MSDVKQDGRSGRWTFTLEFKQQAVRLVTEEKYTFQAAAKALGVGEQSLRQWHAERLELPTADKYPGRAYHAPIPEEFSSG